MQKNKPKIVIVITGEAHYDHAPNFIINKFIKNLHLNKIPLTFCYEVPKNFSLDLTTKHFTKNFQIVTNLFKNDKLKSFLISDKNLRQSFLDPEIIEAVLTNKKNEKLETLISIIKEIINPNFKKILESKNLTYE